MLSRVPTLVFALVQRFCAESRLLPLVDGNFQQRLDDTANYHQPLPLEEDQTIVMDEVILEAQQRQSQVRFEAEAQRAGVVYKVKGDFFSGNAHRYDQFFRGDHDEYFFGTTVLTREHNFTQIREIFRSETAEGGLASRVKLLRNDGLRLGGILIDLKPLLLDGAESVSATSLGPFEGRIIASLDRDQQLLTLRGTGVGWLVGGRGDLSEVAMKLTPCPGLMRGEVRDVAMGAAEAARSGWFICSGQPRSAIWSLTKFCRSGVAVFIGLSFAAALYGASQLDA
ncbi:MAG: hypothetical protein HYT76_07130 [Deltaproteobacteria bacterium]|nr:hypothetical protein [Deltaproteobacteria bacterium]